MLRIIADSACDITQSEAQKLGITVIPMAIHFDGEIYKDGIDIDNQEFFQRLAKAEKLPTTSQINPAQFEQVFQEYIDRGDELLVITVSSQLSATYQSAVIAANAVAPDRIFVLDSLSASLGEELLIREALRIKNAINPSAEALFCELQKLVPKMKLFASIDTLKYLQMGGRLSSGTAIIGEFLGIIPIAHLDKGKIEMLDKVRGEKNAMKKLSEIYHSYDIDKEKGIIFSHSAAPQKLQRFMDYIAPDLNAGPVFTGSIGSVIGTHTGPGFIGISFFVK